MKLCEIGEVLFNFPRLVTKNLFQDTIYTLQYYDTNFKTISHLRFNNIVCNKCIKYHL